MRLKLAREAEQTLLTESELREALGKLGDANEFAILSRSDNAFIQAGVADGGFVINQAMGQDRFVHWAARPGFSPSKKKPYDVLSFAELQDVFSDYYRGDLTPGLSWRPENIDERPWSDTAFRLFFTYAFWPLLILMFVGSMYLKWKR
jgi:hypothetical protein